MWQVILISSVLVWFHVAPVPQAYVSVDPGHGRAVQGAQFFDLGDRTSEVTTLSIPRLGLRAPIVFSINSDEGAIQKDLENGVVHFPDTALPGEEGNVVLFGHSSQYFWRPGSYKTIFAHLDQLQSGDQLYITQGERVYTYTVFNRRIVSPRAVDVLDPTEVPMLTLITCTPRGTSLRRLVVQAKEIRPVQGVEFSEDVAP